MKNIITANDLKTRGIKYIVDKQTENKNEEILVTHRGITKYAIIPIEYFNKLREYEIEIALKESLREIETGKYFEESVAKHIERISK